MTLVAAVNSNRWAGQLWTHLSTRVVVSNLSGIFAAMAVLGALLVWSRAWNGVVRRVVVWCHEWGHVVAAVLCGGRVSGMRLNHETSGATNFRLRRRRRAKFRQTFVAFCGNPSPGVVGLILVACVANGYAYAGLVVLTLFVVGTVVLIRNWWGLGLVLGAAVLLGACTWLVSPVLAAWPVLAVAAVLIWGGLRDIFVAVGNRRAGAGARSAGGTLADANSDSAQVAKAWHVPRWAIEGAWLVLWGICVVGSVALVVWPPS
jgi:hypothetical protein